MKIFQCVSVYIPLLLLTSCATIVNGTTQKIGIGSNPAQADVFVDSSYAGTTPLIVEMTRRENHFLRIELEGYHPYEVQFQKRLSGWVFGNIVFGGVIGLAVDAISGGIYRLTPEQVQAELRSDHVRFSKMSEDSQIFVVLQPRSDWEKIGNLNPL